MSGLLWGIKYGKLIISGSQGKLLTIGHSASLVTASGMMLSVSHIIDFGADFDKFIPTASGVVCSTPIASNASCSFLAQTKQISSILVPENVLAGIKISAHSSPNLYHPFQHLESPSHGGRQEKRRKLVVVDVLVLNDALTGTQLLEFKSSQFLFSFAYLRDCGCLSLYKTLLSLYLTPSQLT